MSAASKGSTPTQKEHYLATYEREHATTMRVLHAYPVDQLDLRPHPKLKTARELAWIFCAGGDAGGHGLRRRVCQRRSGRRNAAAAGIWDELLQALERSHAELGERVRAASDEELRAPVHFLTAPQTLGEVSRIDFLWFLLADQIHHRGQFSVYLRMAGGAVPSIYGPTADEPWM